MTEELKNGVAWQRRGQTGNMKAFFLTVFEAFINPVEYYQKLLVEKNYTDPLILCFYCSFYLAGPLVSRSFPLSYFLAIVFIVTMTPVLIFVLAFVLQKFFSLLGEEISYEKCFYVLAYASVAFVLAGIPYIGFWVCLTATVGLVAVGERQVFKIHFMKIGPTLLIVPFLVLVPAGAVGYAQNWEKNHPVVDIEIEAQKVLAVLSIAAENYAQKHAGQYPKNSAVLVSPDEKYLVQDYCQTTLNNYKISCEFRNYGYLFTAEPVGWQGRGKKTFYVTTKGKLRER